MKTIKALSLCILLTFLFTCDSGPSESQDTSKMLDSLSLSKKLAMLDAKGAVADTDINYLRIKYLLNEISTTYKESPDTIAEWTSKVQGALHDQGIKESCKNILEEMNKTGKVENSKFKDVITLYALYRSKQ